MMTVAINPVIQQWSELIERPIQSVDQIETLVNEVFTEIKEKGDEALNKYTKRFDGVDLKNICVSKNEIELACNSVSDTLKKAIQEAKANIELFHKAQVTGRVSVSTTEGVDCWQEKRPIQKIGIYIPGGTAPLFSTVLMLAIPANIAGVQDIVLCSPPNSDAKIADEIIYTAQLCGITKILKVGGIQAIAGMTFGTETIPKVYKIFGPGNQYVTVAKQLATKYGVAIDMPAGPSELLVIADSTANASFVASDLLSQAEHGEDSQVILVSTSKQLIEDVGFELKQQLDLLPRKAIAEVAIQNSKSVFFDSYKLALDFVNSYAPEHLIVCTKNESYFSENIINAGSVFIGNYTPESAGDYASGTNHTLPTNGYSKAYSGVNLDSFTKAITFQKISKTGLLNIGSTIEKMAEAEGLQAHKNAVSIRLDELKKQVR